MASSSWGHPHGIVPMASSQWRRRRGDGAGTSGNPLPEAEDRDRPRIAAPRTGPRKPAPDTGDWAEIIIMSIA